MKTIGLTLVLFASALAPAQSLRELGSQLLGDLGNNVVAQVVDSRLDGDLNGWNAKLNRKVGRVAIPAGSRLYFMVDDNSSGYGDDLLVKKAKAQARYWGSNLKLGPLVERGERPEVQGSYLIVHLSATQYHGFEGMDARFRNLFSGLFVSRYAEKDFAEISCEITDSAGFSSADDGIFEVLGADVGRKGLSVDLGRVGFSQDSGDNISRELDDAFCRLTKAMTGTDPRDLEKRKR